MKNRVMQNRILTLKYEDMVLEPYLTTSKLYQFINASEEDLKSYRKSTFKLSSCGAAARPEPSEKPINTTTNSLEASTRPFK